MATSHKEAREAKRMRRLAAREARLEAQRRVAARRRRRNLAIYGGIAVVVVAVIGVLTWSAVRPGQIAGLGAKALPSGKNVDVRVEEIPSQGADHIQLGKSHPPYNSNPPTSGWHTPQTVPWGSHRVEIADEIVIHNLEHGGIWISYKDPNDTALVEKLEALVKRYRSKVIVTPRSKNDSPIALAAWTRLLKLQEFDEKLIVDFISAYRNKGPEMTPD